MTNVMDTRPRGFCRIALSRFIFSPSALPQHSESRKMPLLEENPAFTGKPETHICGGILFDMDGTIVDSTDAIVKHWHKCVLPSRPLCSRYEVAYGL